MIQMARENGNMINESNNIAFDKPSFFCNKRFLLLFTTRFRYFRKYGSSYPQRGQRNLYRLFQMQYTPRTYYSDDGGITDQGHLTEKIMNKPQNLYGIALEQNVEQTVHQSTKQKKVVLILLLMQYTLSLRYY